MQSMEFVFGTQNESIGELLVRFPCQRAYSAVIVAESRKIYLQVMPCTLSLPNVAIF